MISFGNNKNDVIGLGLSYWLNSRPFTHTRSSGNYIQSRTSLLIGRWTHIAAVLNGTNASVYIDGKLTATGVTNFPIYKLYATNYLGRSNYFTNGDEEVNAEISQVKLFNRSLSSNEILDDFNRM